MEDPATNLRSAIREYGQTEQGRCDVDYACGYYNWGDAAHAAMDEILSKYGLKPISEHTIDVFVNYDEVLVDCDEESEEEL